MSAGKTAVELAADLSAGLITQNAIKNIYGDTMLSTVLGLGGGLLAGVAMSAALDVIDRETGLVSDVGSLVDDVFSIFD